MDKGNKTIFHNISMYVLMAAKWLSSFVYCIIIVYWYTSLKSVRRVAQNSVIRNLGLLIRYHIMARTSLSWTSSRHFNNGTKQVLLRLHFFLVEPMPRHQIPGTFRNVRECPMYHWKDCRMYGDKEKLPWIRLPRVTFIHWLAVMLGDPITPRSKVDP